MAGVHALPLRHSRSGGIYYGWYIVGAAVIAQMMAMGLQTYAMSVFLKPMTAEFGWSREEFANAQTIGTFVTGGLGFFLGTLIDRRGSRPLMIAGTLITGGCMIGIAQVDSLAEFYLLRGIGVTVGAMGIGNLVVNVTVAKWFVRNRGLAVAIAATGISLGGVIMTPVTQALVARYGWRDAWVVLGIAVWVIVLPTAFVMRRSPEEYGLCPDGDPPGGSPGRAPAVEENWTRPEAVRTAAIWLLIVAWGLCLAGISALMLHMVSFLTDSGFSPGTAVFLFSIQAWAALASKGSLTAPPPSQPNSSSDKCGGRELVSPNMQDAGPQPAQYVISSDCMNCGVCEFMCPVGAIVPAPQHFIIRPDQCDGCGRCVPYCIVRAIVPREGLAARQERTVKAGLRKALDGALT